MSKFNKEFTHKGYKFNTTVKLYTKAEKRPGGKVWHKIVTNSIDGFGYYHTEEIENFKLAQKIIEHRNLAVNYYENTARLSKIYEWKELRELMYCLKFEEKIKQNDSED